jgi:hypothetical protein
MFILTPSTHIEVYKLPRIALDESMSAGRSPFQSIRSIRAMVELWNREIKISLLDGSVRHLAVAQPSDWLRARRGVTIGNEASAGGSGSPPGKKATDIIHANRSSCSLRRARGGPRVPSPDLGGTP